MNIFITGISKGLGLALAKTYTRRGDAVLGVSRSEPRDLSDAVTHRRADVTLDEVGVIISQMVEGLSSIDLLINNAGCGSSGFNVESVRVAEVSHQLELHCVGTLRATQALLPKLRNADQPKIINITSRLGSITRHMAGDFADRKFSYPYRIAKCAQNMLTVCLASDTTLGGIVVASVNPGLLRTDSGSSDAEHTAEDAASRIVPLIDAIDCFGAYHAYDEPTEL